MKSFIMAAAVIIALALPFIVFNPLRAQTPQGQAVMTWRALNFFPADFRGKALPTEGSRVAASVAYLESGKFVNLSNLLIRWYVDGTFATRGTGLTEYIFKTTKQNGEMHVVRVSIEFAGGGKYESSVMVPVNDRRLVLRGAGSQTLAPDTDATIEAFPYFFNVASLADLTFFWTVNGARAAGVNGNALTITVPHANTTPGGALDVSVVAQGKRDLIEYAAGKTSERIAQ
jgi:hypothetical protein